MSYKVEKKDLIGEIKDFPIEVVQKMIDTQINQYGKEDISVFQKSPNSSYGFIWGDTKEGFDFWMRVIDNKKFDVFFEKYPKNELESEQESDNKYSQILVIGERISVVINPKDEVYRPMILKGTTIFNPTGGFRPLNPGPKQKMLDTTYHEEARNLIARGESLWTPPVKEREQVPVETKPVHEESKPSASSTLDALIAESVAKIASKNVVDAARPLIDEYIKDTYGVLPKIIEVHGPNGIHKVDGVKHGKFETILTLVNSDIPVFLTGPAGCGKNVLCKQVSEALGYEFYFSNAVTQEYKLTGFIDANGRYHETQFFKAFTQGGLFMLDEIDASTPEVLVILNAAIANRYFDFPTGRVTAHKDFRVVAAGNTYGTGADIEYTGRYQLDASSLDRFAIIEVDYDENIEEAIAVGNKQIVNFIHDLRNAISSAKIKFTVSYRAIERLVKLEEVFDIEQAIRIAILRGMDMEDAKMISKSLSSSSNKYVSSFKAVVA